MIDRFSQYSFLMAHPNVYRIRVVGRLNRNWSKRLRGLALFTVEEGDAVITEICGQLPDQAALMGVLDELYSCGIPVISMECVGFDPCKKV